MYCAARQVGLPAPVSHLHDPRCLTQAHRHTDDEDDVQIKTQTWTQTKIQRHRHTQRHIDDDETHQSFNLFLKVSDGVEICISFHENAANHVSHSQVNATIVNLPNILSRELPRRQMLQKTDWFEDVARVYLKWFNYHDNESCKDLIDLRMLLGLPEVISLPWNQ